MASNRQLLPACRSECEPLIQLKATILRQHQTHNIILRPDGSFDIIEVIRNEPAKLMVERVDAQLEEILDKYRKIWEKEVSVSGSTALLPKRDVIVTSQQVYDLQ